MVLLFLRPESALGLSVDVNAVKKFPNFPAPAGFKIDEPVIIDATIELRQGEFGPITRATVEVSQLTGDGGYLDFGAGKADPAIDLPLPTPPNYTAIEFFDLSDKLPELSGETQGLLFADVDLVQILPDAFGYGYGYRGQQGGGSIKFKIKYTPPGIVGTYRATVKVYNDENAEIGSETPTNTMDFIVVKPLPAGSVVARPTKYPRSSTEALSRDLVVLQAWVSPDIVGNVVSITVNPGLLNANTDTMDPVSKFHPAILAKWSIDSAEANYLLPMKILPQAEPLTCEVCSASIKVVDIAGQELNLSGSNAAKVNLVATRTTFNIYLMPGINFISTPLQCSAATTLCNGDEFNLSVLLDQPMVNAQAGKTGSGDVIVAVWYYCSDIVSGDTVLTCADINTGDPGDAVFAGFSPGPAPDLLDTIGAGRGYIIKTKPVGDAFQTMVDARSDAQFTTAVPVPIRITFTGDVLAGDASSTTLPAAAVKQVWNLVGLHSERDSTAGNLLKKVDTPALSQRLWLQLFDFRNSVDILLNDAGNVVRDPLTGRPPHIAGARRFPEPV